MKCASIAVFFLILASGCAGFNLSPHPEQTGRDSVIDDGWRFTKRDVGGGAQAVGLDDSRWEPVALPHTWNAVDGADGGDDYFRGGCWYRKHLLIDAKDVDKNFFLKFDAAATVADVYVNGRHAGQHRGAFGAFCFDMTDLMRVGQDNVIAVRVDNSKFEDVPPVSGDFTIFGGIYRDVHLLVTSPLCVSPLDDGSCGVYLKPVKHDAASATIEAITKLRNGHKANVNATVVCTIVDAKGTPVAVGQVEKHVDEGRTIDAPVPLTIPHPHLWNGTIDPYLYRAIVQVKLGEFVEDEVTQPLGLRYFDLDANNGFFLNGSHYALHGVNKHQDRLGEGWAISKADLQEDYRFIRELGATCVRMAHYQHCDEEYSICDRMGIVAWAELALVNQANASPAFAQNVKQQLRELIKQNYNHPSICFWSLYNELKFGKDKSEARIEPMSLVSELDDLAKQLDPSRATTSATMLDARHPGNFISDVSGFNRYCGWYGGSPDEWAKQLDVLHENLPGRPIAISEYGAGASINQHEPDRVSRPDTKGTWHPEEWQCTVHEAAWRAMKNRPFLWGTFAWCMFDFASDGRHEGDHFGRNDKGLVTYDRQVRKDAFYFYKANWSDSPVVHICSSRFNPRPAGKFVVKVYSNCDSLELFQDGESIGVGSGSDGVYLWQVNAPPGPHKFLAVGQKGGKTFKDLVGWDLRR